MTARFSLILGKKRGHRPRLLQINTLETDAFSTAVGWWSDFQAHHPGASRRHQKGGEKLPG
jgi:hypothetical protein